MTQRNLKIPAPQFQLLVALLAALIPTYLIRWTVFGLPTTFWEVLLYLVTIWAVFAGGLRLRFWRTDPLRWPIAIIFVGSCIGLLVSPHFVPALGQWKAIIVDGFLFYWLIRSATQANQRAARWLTTGVLLSGSIIALEAIFLASRLGQVASDGRHLGLFALDPGASPNYLALYLAPLATIALVAAMQARTRGALILLGLAATSLSLGVVVSGSRAGLVALVAGTALGLAWELARRYPRFRLTIASLVGCLALITLLTVGPSFLPKTNVDPTTANRLTSSNNVRLEIWRTTVTRIIPSGPIWGIGWANFQPLFSELTATQVNYPEYVTPYALHPHNFLLMTWVTLGLVGLLGWLLLFIVLIKHWPRLEAWQLPVAAATITWLIQGLVDTPFYKNDLAALWWLIATLLLATSAQTALARPPSGK